VFFHRTDRQAADTILANGFRDASGTYLTSSTHKGVWLSDVPLDANEGARGDVLLLIVMRLFEAEQDQYEWVEEGKGFREWLFPAALVNAHSSILEATTWLDDETLSERVAELKTELEKLPANRQQQLKQELDEGKEN
jgi:hypothetical protein